MASVVSCCSVAVLQMFFHGTDYESLHAHIEPKYLPKVYGGIRPDFGYRDWFESVSQNPTIVKGKTDRIPCDSFASNLQVLLGRNIENN